MQFLRRCGYGVILGFVLAPSPAMAAWSVWPFGNREDLPRQPPPTRQMTGMNLGGHRQTLDNNDPSVFTRLTTGPQRLITSTKQALSFGGNNQPTPTSWSGGSSRQKKKAASSSWFGWLRPAEPEGPKTVSEWFKLKRPE